MWSEVNMKCRFCNKELVHSLVDLGLSPISNEYIDNEHLDKGQYYFPLEVMVCDECFLAQVKEYRAPENIFTNYKYFSSYSKSWLNHCKEYVEMIINRLNLSSDSLVYEIACNDGYLLQYFLPHNIPVCGIEPAENVAKIAQNKGIDVKVKFWGEETAKEISTDIGKANLIIGNNVLAHVPDLNGFVEGVNLALSDKGTATFEFPHLLQLMQYNQFDTIYQEHFSYFSFITACKVFEKHGLEVYDVEELTTHGGSLRIYVKHKHNFDLEVSKNVGKLLDKEKTFAMEKIETYLSFSDNVKKIKRDSCELLIDLKNQQKKIMAFGAAAKGNTFLNYCGIGKEYIDFVADSNKEKQGMYLPGTRIQIVSPEKIIDEKPDYIVILPWNLKDEISSLLEYTREWGCKFITFIPKVEVF